MEIKIKTLTPLWTGGAETGRMDRIHETGIIGSLRWWYEAVLRGLGTDVCDPTSDNRCQFDSKAYQKSGLQAGLKNVCPACRLFGCSGWQRRFRLTVHDRTQEQSQPKGAKSTTGQRYKKGGQQRPSWYFNGGHGGEFCIGVQPFCANFDAGAVHLTLRMIERYGGLGAKTHIGYGQIAIIEPIEMNVSKFIDNSCFFDTNNHKSVESAAISNMFFAEVDTPEPDLTATLNLRFDVRAAFRQGFRGNPELRHFVCGTVKGNKRQGSKVFYSQAMNKTLKLWGWMPEKISVESVTRDEVVAAIYKAVSTFGRIRAWREFNSNRDKVQQCDDKRQFLLSLIQD